MLSILGKVLQLLPALFAAIKAAEEFFGAGNGAQKKAAVMQAAKAALEGTNAVAKVKEIDDPEEQSIVMQAVDKTIDAVVSLANVAGIFKHGGLPPTPSFDPIDATASGGR